ncbi:hypothetical protein BBJ28_00017743 [Nothophytophthora sp. Chile5]|nr:hypothetical protein BBJ28_00017743 [Nothophytophthora sp. Chile5]
MDGTFALDLVLWLYAMIEHNDFVILHAVTSAWALQQLEHLLKPADRVRAWKVWLHVALSAFVTAQIRDLRDSDICELCSDELPGLDSWSQIIARTLGLAEQGLLERDLVHVYKLVQVAHGHEADMTTRGGVNEKSFLSAEERDYITRKSALKAISVDFAPF